MENLAKRKLESGKAAIGCNLTVMNPDAIKAVSNSGFDWVLYDLEHGPRNIETVNEMIMRSSPSRASTIIRVVWDDRNAIKRALDTGAFGIIVPWVTTREMARDAVTYARYPPLGLRGCGPGRAARAWGMPTEDYIEIANEEIMVAIQIERKEAVDAVEDIVSVEGVDATWIGPADLSLSMGLKVTDAFTHPKVIAAMDRVIDACNDAGVAPGIAGAGDAEKVNGLIERGFRFILAQGDLNLLEKGGKEYLKSLTV